MLKKPAFFNPAFLSPGEEYGLNHNLVDSSGWGDNNPIQITICQGDREGLGVSSLVCHTGDRDIIPWGYRLTVI